MRLVTKIALILSGVALFIIGVVYFIFKTIVIPEQVEFAKNRTKSLAVILKNNVLGSMDGNIQKIFEELQKNERNISYVVLVDTSGKAIYHSNPQRVNMIFADTNTINSIKRGVSLERIYTRDVNIPGSPYYNEKVFDVMLPFAGYPKGYGTLGLGLSLKYLDELEAKYYSITIIILLTVILIIVINFFLIYKSFIRPIRELADETKKFRSGSYLIQPKKNRKDEIGVLFDEFYKTSSTLNRLLDELKKSKGDLSGYIDQLPHFNIKLSLNGDILLANSITQKCSGFSLPELTNKKFWELFPEKEGKREKVHLLFEEALSKGKVEFEEEINNSYCSDKIVAFTMSHVSSDDQNLYLVVDGMDITEKKKIDNELRNKSREIKALFDNVPGYLYFKDTSGNYVACNQRFADLVGVSLTGIVGKKDSDLFPESKIEVFKKQDEFVINNGKLLEIDEEEFTLRNHRMILMKKKVPLKDESGKIIGVIGVAFDITALKTVEKALKDSEERFKSLVDNIPYGVVEIDYEGNITFINQAVSQLSGYDREEVLVKKNWDFANNIEDKNYIKDRLETIKDKDVKPKSLVFKSRTKNGILIDLQVDSNIRRDTSGKLLGIVSVITDITEKKRIQNELIRSEEKYRNIFEKSSLGIYRTKINGEILDINLSFAKMFGYETIEEMKINVSKSSELYYDNKEREILISELQKTEEMLKFQIRFKRKNGSIMIGNLNIRVLPEGEGKERVLEGFIEDITEGFNYEKQIKEQLVFMQTLIDTIPNPIFYRDENSVYEGCNNAYEKTIGINRDKIIGKTPTDIFPEKFAQETIDDDKKLLSDLKTQQSDLELMDADGNLRDYISQRAVFYHIDGAIAGIIGVLVDVTERKKNERDLKQKLDLLDIAPVSFFVIDMNSKMLYWNKGSEQLYGIKSEEIVGKDLGELMMKGSLSMQEYSYLLNIKDTALEKDYWEGELKQVNDEGKELTIESKAKLARNVKGEAEYVLIVNLDVTERKKLESQLLLSQRLESLGTLASGIAHDLNNMLSPIVLGLDIIKNKLKDGESIEWIKTLQDTAKRGSELVKQILSFARGLSDKFTFVQPRYIISEFIKIIKGTFPKSIQITKEVGNDLWAIMGDSTQINQLLMNLCVNARDAMPEGGNLKVSAENVIIDENILKTNVAAKLGPYICINVTDTGSGIDQKILSKIFDPFFTTKEVGKGTGLGLSTVFNIVKNHKGFLNVYSELGKGTSFKIYIPAVKSEVEEKEIVIQNIPYGKQELILIVDDETAVREIIRATLEAYGYEVLSATNGAEAVALFAKHLLNVKAAIVDMIMPVMDGSATIQALKTINPELKIIAASGFDDAKDKPIIEKVDGFLAKPFTAEAILKLLSDVLSS